MDAAAFWAEIAKWETTKQPLNPGSAPDPYFVANPLPPNASAAQIKAYGDATQRVARRLEELLPRGTDGAIDWKTFEDWVHWSMDPSTTSSDSNDPSGRPTRPLMNNGGMSLWVGFCQRYVASLPLPPPNLVGAAADHAFDTHDRWRAYLEVIRVRLSQDARNGSHLTRRSLGAPSVEGGVSPA